MNLLPEIEMMNRRSHYDHQKTLVETALTIALAGRLDTTTAPQLEAELKESLNGVTALTLDMAMPIFIARTAVRT